MRVGGEHTELVCVSPNEGTVLPQDRARCELTFSPPVKMVLKGCDIQLQVSVLYRVTLLESSFVWWR